MNLIEEHNKRYQFFKDITGNAMKVLNAYKSGLLESAYEAALQYLLEKEGHKVERQVYLPIYWEDVKLNQTYRMDLLIDDHIIIELKSVSHIETVHRKQLWNYMNLTHIPHGMLLNFGTDALYSEWYERDEVSKKIEKIRLI